MSEVGAALISVLVPSYNHSKYLPACLSSIYEDDYPNLEVIVLDDGSTDDSVQVAGAWRESHPGKFKALRVEQQANSGIGRTANRLIGMARGDFLAFIASDDCLIKGGLALRVEALKRHPEWLAVFGDCAEIDASGQQTKGSVLVERYGADLIALQSPRLRASELILNWSVPGPGFMARPAAYVSGVGVGPYDETLFVEDRDFYLRLLSKGALGFVNAPVASYRVHGLNAIRLPELQPKIARDVADSERRNLHRFRGLEAFLLAVVWLRNIAYYFMIKPGGQVRRVWALAFRPLETCRKRSLQRVRSNAHAELRTTRDGSH